MNWRIYRLPGSREIWHIDAGCGTPVFNVRGYKCYVPSFSVDIGGNNSPRAWIEIREGDFHTVNGTAIFMQSQKTKEFLARCISMEENEFICKAEGLS